MDFATIFADRMRYDCDKGQVLIRPDEEPRGVFLLYSGYVKAYDINTSGEYQLINISMPGNIFPIQWALGEGAANLFYEAMSACEFSIMPLKQFQAHLDNPAILKCVVKALLQSFQYYQFRIQNFEYRTARERLAFRLLFLGKFFGRRTGSTYQIDVSLTYQDLAESLNLTRETVNRTMRQFAKSGFIEVNRHTVRLLDTAALHAVLGNATALDI